MRILLIEDDHMVGRALVAGLAQDLHATDWVRSVADAEAAWLAPAAGTSPYEAVLVDLGLPDGSGLELIRRARARKLRSIVLVLTARGSIADRIAGLNAGADDYMVKPVDLDELAARLRAIDRREQGRSAEVREFGPLSIDTLAGTVALRGEAVALTAQEFAILCALARRPGAIVSRARIEESLYGWNDSSESNTIEVQIHRLRRKLGAATIQTHRGLGYRLVEPVPP
ncbi:MAG: response regulator transcription factor [Burkholderiales bacterium]|nr:response regulator transcription factor [Burkholderiales bacterium]MDE2457310.1 response regulator transcription factor [Burkholderiales bacterium]